MDSKRFETLSAKNRALVAMAVLLDGHEASVYLGNDNDFGEAFEHAAFELANMPPELRMPFVGTLLRTAIEELE